MEGNTKYPTKISSDDINRVLQTSITNFHRKRKLQAEQLGVPPPKYVCANQNFALEYDFSSDAIPEGETFCRCIAKREMNVMTRAESEPESANDSNSVAADADSVISVSGEAETDQGCSKEYSFDQRYTSPLSLRANSSKNALHLVQSILATKSGSGKLESPTVDEECDSPHNIFGLHSSMNYTEDLLEFGDNEDFSCSEYRASIEECSDKELEEMLYSNGVTPNNYVLSSGRWTVNQDNQQGEKKLTIDKEFEEYFSMLML